MGGICRTGCGNGSDYCVEARTGRPSDPICMCQFEGRNFSSCRVCVGRSASWKNYPVGRRLLTRLGRLARGISSACSSFICKVGYAVGGRSRRSVRDIVSFVGRGPREASSSVVRCLSRLKVWSADLTRHRTLLFYPMIPLVITL